MPAISATDANFEVRAAEAIRGYLEGLTTLATWQAANASRVASVRRFGDPRDQAFPVIVVRVTGLRQAWPGADEFKGRCVVAIGAQVDTPAPGKTDADTEEAHRVANQTAIHSLATLVEVAMADQGAIRTFCNVGGGSRTATDFHFYSFTDHSPDTELADDDLGRRWEVAFDRAIVAARCDYAA